MKIQITSDLHLDFQDNDVLQILNCECDILVIAGDVYPGPKVINHLLQIHKFHISKPKIIFVPGNHEYYGYSKAVLDEDFEKYKYLSEKVIILNNEYIWIDGVTFIGGTGWWDESNGKITQLHQWSMRDFRVIKDINYNNFGIDWGKGCRRFFEKSLEEVSGNVVCISHNGPTKKCVKQYQGSRFNTLFQNDWKDLVKKHQPNYWIYGHTHEYIDYKVDNTRCICNPLGYPDEVNNFNPCLTIEI